MQISLCCNSVLCEIHTKTKPVYSECPLCHSSIFKTSSNPEADKEIQGLLIYCPNKDTGCRWVGKLSQLNLHCNSDDEGCPFQKVKCPSNCGRLLQRQNVSEHLATECPCYCQYCKVTANETLIASQHKENCTTYIQQCPNKCGMKISHGSIHEHRKVCPLEEVQCEYYSLGCRNTMLRQDKEEHHKDNLINHLDLIKHKISDKHSLKSYWIRVYATFLLIILMAILSQFYYMKTSFEDIENLRLIRIENDDLKANLAITEVQNKELRNDLEDMRNHVEQCLDLKDEISYIDDSVDDINKESSNLRKDINILQNQMVALEIKIIVYVQILEEYNTTIAKQLNRIENVMNVLNRTNATYASIKEFINITNSTYMDMYEMLKNQLYGYEKAIQNNSAELKKIAKESYGTMMSTNWRLYLTMVHLVALHGDRVMPVVLAMHDYSWYVNTSQEWFSTEFFNTANGNYMCLSVKPFVFNISVALHLLSRVHNMQEGTFIIEMMNQYNDTDHSVGEIPYSEPKTSAMSTEVESSIIGNVRYNISSSQENVVYLHRDVLYFRVSFIYQQ